MKKIFLCLISLILVLSSLLSFTACDSEEPPAAEESLAESTTEETTASPTEEATTAEETTAPEEETGAVLDKNGKYPILNKLTVAAIGDSYIAGTGGKWPDILALKYGMRYYNYGISGSTVSSYVTDRNPMVKRYQEMAAVDANIVIIEGGRNDFNAYTPIGNVDSRNPITFSGALNTIIDASKEKYPDAMIVLITPWNFPDKDTHPMTYLHYVNAMLAVAEYQGERVYCINASDTSLTGVDMRSSSFRRTYCLKESDVSHLNSRGMQMVAPRFEKILAEYYADFLSHKK
jgi:lysophospholipase L1-like esterase